MTNQTEVIQRAIEATEMGFWDSAVQRLLENGWGVTIRPTDDTPRLGSFFAEVVAKTNTLVMPDYPDCPMFGSGYSKGFQDALVKALNDLLSELTR